MESEDDTEEKNWLKMKCKKINITRVPKITMQLIQCELINKFCSSEKDGDIRSTVNEVHNGSKNNRCEKMAGEQVRSDQGKDLSLSKSD